MSKKLLALLMACLMLAAMLAGCGGQGSGTQSGENSSGAAGTGTQTSGGGAPEYQWKMALNSTEGDNAYDTGALFAEKVKELTDGRVEVTLYGGASLGSTTEVLEGMSVGVADVLCESVGTLAPFTPLANVEAMPYMINSYDHFVKVWHGEIGEEIKEAVGDAAGFKLLGGTYRGPRIVTATKEMHTIEDFKGFKLRAPNLEMYIKTWEWFGAAPTPMAMNEVFTALQQKTVEGQENPMVDSLNYSFDEVCNYWIKTNHVYGCNVIIFDKAYFESLPEDIQAACAEAAEYAGKEISAAQAAKDAAAEEALIAEGKTVIEVDNEAFAEYFKDFAATNYPDFADWVARIAAAK